jgi:hypothetical protein
MKMRLAIAVMALQSAQAAMGAPSVQTTAKQPSLSQCIAMRTTGADRMLTAQWLFAVMSKSPQIAHLSAVTAERTSELDKDFARLMARLITKDCIDQVRPLAAGDVKDAFEQVGGALGEIAMKELMTGKEVDKGVGAYGQYLSEEDFKPLMDSLPKKSPSHP